MKITRSNQNHRDMITPMLFKAFQRVGNKESFNSFYATSMILIPKPGKNSMLTKGVCTVEYY